MNAALNESILLWVVIFIVVAPLVVIGAGEIEGRLRFKDSPFVHTISILRVWVLPLIAIWLVVVAVVGVDGFLSRVVATIAVIAIAADLIAVAAVFIGMLRTRAESGARRSVPRLLLAVPKIVVVVLVAWVLLQVVWSVDLSAVFQALGVTTLIISVALQDTLGGIASGFLLMFDRPFQPGDWIKADDIEGRVIDTNWRSSRIENRDRDLVVVPNGKLANATIINYDEPVRLHRVQVELQVAFTNPPTLAKEMILDAAQSVPGVLDDPPPFVAVTQIDDPLMGYEVHMWIEDFSIEPRVMSDFRSLVWYMSHRHDVPLPSPAYDLYTYDGLAASAASEPDPAEVRERLLSSHLLDGMDDAEVDRLTAVSKPYRFAEDEIVSSSLGDDPILYTLWEGEALLQLHGPEGRTHTIASLASGDIFGLVNPPEHEGFSIAVVAVTDCEVVGTDLDAAGPVIARNPLLVSALAQIRATRSRRISRAVATMTAGAVGALETGEEVSQ